MSESLYPSFGILLVDDEPAWLRSLGMTLEGPGGISNLILCRDSREAMGLLARHDIGLVLLDLTMPHLSGRDLLQMIAENHPEVTVIIISGMNQIETAVDCMKKGAFDYFVKTDDEDHLLDGVRRAVRVQELERENRALRSQFLPGRLEHPAAFSSMVTRNSTMHALFSYIESVARSTHPVLITGESGVGKELVARAVHELSGRKGPIISVNVAGLDDNIFSDTLFGHVRGAFTGADSARSGMIEKAADGTLFLDEIGDLSTTSQVKLLRLLQEGEFYPLGSDTPCQMKARILVATHQDLGTSQREGIFRKDLYYRLRSHHVHIPPLRERKEDIPLLLDHFLAKAADALDKRIPTPPKQLEALLATYHFPGNIRELEAMVFDAVSAHTSKILSMQTFQKTIGLHDQAESRDIDSPLSADNPFAGLVQLPTLAEADALLVEEALNRASGNQTLASRLLGISQPALSKRLKQKTGKG